MTKVESAAQSLRRLGGDVFQEVAMLLSLQFPLADVRKFIPDNGALKAPVWPLPDLRHFVHFHGRINRRRGGGVEGWGENEICAARRAFRFEAGLNFDDAATGMYLPMNCAFRRFSFDGYAAGKFEVGISPGERPFSLSRPQTIALLNHSLNLPIRVPTTGGDMRQFPLVQAGPALARLYALSTTRRDYGIEQVQKWWVSDGPPLLFVEHGPRQALTLPRGALPVPLDEKHGLRLFYYSYETNGQWVPLWVLQRLEEAPNPAARTLRLYLMRLHAEHECLKLTLQRLRLGDLTPAEDSQEADLLQNYVHQAVKNISGMENKSAQKLGVDIGAVAYEAMSMVSPHEIQQLRRIIADLGLRTNSPVSNSSPVREWTRVQLLSTLTNLFNLEELKTLCFLLDVEYDDLVGEGLTGKGRALVTWAERHDMVTALVEAILKERPHAAQMVG